MKTFAADFLCALCKFQDGTLTQIFEHAFSILENRVQNQYSKSTMLTVMCCLKDNLRDRKDIKLKLSKLLILLVDQIAIPTVD